MAILVAPIAAATDGPIGVWASGPPMSEHPLLAAGLAVLAIPLVATWAIRRRPHRGI
jgi:hypothetical protein